MGSSFSSANAPTTPSTHSTTTPSTHSTTTSSSNVVLPYGNREVVEQLTNASERGSATATTTTTQSPPPSIVRRRRRRSESSGLESDGAGSTSSPHHTTARSIRQRLDTTSSHATAATSDFSPRTSLLRQTLSLNATSSIPGAPIQNSFRAPSLVATSTPPTTASTPSTTLPTHLSATTSPSILRYALEAVLTNMVSRRNGMSVGAFYFQGDVGVLEGDEREVVGGIPLVIIGLRERETPTSTFAPPSTAHDGSTVATALNELANVMSESTATIESTPFSPMNSPNNDVTSNPIPPQDPPLAPPPSAASLDAEDASNSPSQGWLMYIIGGPQTADALEQLNDRPITAEQQNIARTQLFEIRGQYTLILRDGATELSDSLPPPDASDSTPTNPANAANPFRFPNSFAAILSSLLTEASDTPLTSGTPTLDRYEMFHRLADFLGPARPRNISKDTVERLLPATTIAVHLKSPLLEVSLAHAPPCPICLVKYQAVDSIRVLPCDHYFHTPCIDAWVCGHVNNCPLCRSDAAVEASTSLDP